MSASRSASSVQATGCAGRLRNPGSRWRPRRGVVSVYVCPYHAMAAEELGGMAALTKWVANVGQAAVSLGS